MKRLSFLALFLIATPAFAQREYGFDNTKPSGQPYLTPQESLKRMKIADGFEIKLFAAEPMITNPIAFTIDERGRVWAVESFEYPSRTPKGKMPRDRIVILEDTDGDGVADKRTVFAEGKDFPFPFDMASGIEVGHGGVFLGAPPYLWFIENKNDKPGKFEVLLKGFGSEDTHETLNTFQWGPDGWLYGLHGVFTQSNVATPDAQAKGNVTKLNGGVWRYHPVTKKFEIFSEGTSNPWGMDYRNTDGQFILCCCVIPHLFHMIPGGIYKRQAGASYNPYAYGQINEICDHTFHKESGWAHAGLISLDAPHIPKEYQNSVIFGSIHGCSVKRNVLERKGSTYVAHRADDFLVSGDKNFRPINMKWGPVGDIYLSDWHDQNPCHQAKPDSWDYERGRIFRIQVKGTKTKKAEDLGKLSLEQLCKLAGDVNPYLARTAARLVNDQARSLTDSQLDELSVVGPSAIANQGPVSAYALADKLLLEKRVPAEELAAVVSHMQEIRDQQHPIGSPKHWYYSQNPVSRLWTIRHLAEIGATDSVLSALAEFAKGESDPGVRREIACTALRSPLASEKPARSVLHALMLHKEDANDPVIPFMIWLAYESKTRFATGDELVWLQKNAPNNPLIINHIVSRFMRRVVADREREALDEGVSACVEFAGTVKDPAVRKKALDGLSMALKDRVVDAPPGWGAVRTELLKDADGETQRYINLLSVSFRDPEAMKRAYEIALDTKHSPQERAEAVRQLALLRHPQAASTLISLTRKDQSLPVRVEAMRSLAMLNQTGIDREVLESWSKYPPEVRAEAANMLAGRKEWARTLLNAVGAKKVARTDLTDNTILRISSFNDRNLNAQVAKVWGKMRSTPKELDELINKMRDSLYEAPGSFERGRATFEATCAKCHTFDGKGAEVGPHLDGAARDIEYLLGNILDPNRVIGQPYFVHQIEKKNGTSEIGLLAAEDAQSITLKVENGVLKTIAKKDIESHVIQEKSLMPEGLDKNLTPQSFRDLIRYVMANPFITQVKLNGKDLAVGVPGRIPLKTDKNDEAKIEAEVTAPAALKTRLMLGSSAALVVKLNGKQVYSGRPGANQPDRAAAEVNLIPGVNRLEIEAKWKGSAAVYARFLDPERKLRYPDK